MSILISKEVQQRNKDNQEKKKEEKIALAYKTAGISNERQKQVDASVDDDYMKNALTQVRNNDVSIDVNFSRFNGTSLYNTESKAPGSQTKTKTKTHNRVPIVETKLKPEPATSKKKTLKEQNASLSWTTICEQVGHKRLDETKSNSYFGKLRQSLKSTDNYKLDNLKRSTEIER